MTKGMKVGEVKAFEAHGRRFEVKRLDAANVYHLRDVAVSERSRFGTAHEIGEDIAVVLECGALPRAGRRW